MAFGNFIRRYFARKRNPQLDELEAFASERKGVEGYIEPRTPTNPATLLLVDRAGDYLRAAVRAPEDAAAFCERHGLPVYDAKVVGYPRRMRRGASRAGDDLDQKFAEIERHLRDEPGTDR